MAQDRDVQQGDAPSKAPISAHPAFRLIVGLWFAALLGLGTIVLPASVIEKAAGWSQGSLTPEIRAAFAFLAALLGFVGGLVLARRFGGKKSVTRALRSHGPLGEGRSLPPRPLSVLEELGEEAIEPAMQEEVRKPLPGRRRRLAAAEDERPGDVPLVAPVPGSDIDSLPSLFIERYAVPESAVEADVPEAYVPAVDVRKPRELAPPPQAALEPRAFQPIDAPLEELGIVQLVERLGRSMQRRLGETRLPDSEPAAEMRSFAPPSVAQGEAGDAALTIPPPVVPDALRAFMGGSPEEFASPPAPAAFRPFAFDAFESDEGEEAPVDESYGSLLSLNHHVDESQDEDGSQAVPESAPEAIEDNESAPPATVARPFDAPCQSGLNADTADSREAPDAVETERALRSALANLQRISGAA